MPHAGTMCCSCQHPQCHANSFSSGEWAFFFLSLNKKKICSVNTLNIFPPLFVYLLTSDLTESLPHLCPCSSYLRDILPFAHEFLELSSWLKGFPNKKKIYIMGELTKKYYRELLNLFHSVITPKGYYIHYFYSFLSKE